MHLKKLAPVLILALALAAPVPALAWGDAPTHFSILYDLVKPDSPALPNLPGAVTANSEVFVQAAAAPDLAWTPLFRTTGRTYVHTSDFAKSLLAVAKSSGNDLWLAMAYAWGAHLAADATGEKSDDANPTGYIPEAEPLHQLVEVAVDTIICDDYPPPTGYASWAQINVSFDSNLLFRASVHYYRNVRRVPLVWPWVAAQALKGLKTGITAEYDYIKLKRGTSLSQAFLEDLADKGIVPSADFSGAYDLSVQAASKWITDHP